MLWQNMYYFDKMSPMGLRSAALFCQRTTNASTFIINNLGFFVMNYLDDFIGAEHRNRIWAAFNALMDTLKKLKVQISENKTVEPTWCMEALGIWMDS